MSTVVGNGTWPPDGSGAARRAHQRWFVDFQTVLKAAGIGMKCAVYDLSPSGACVEPTEPRAIAAGDRIDFDLPGYGPIPAEVQYNDFSCLGLRFLLDDTGKSGVANYLIRVESKNRPAQQSEIPNQPTPELAAESNKVAERDAEVVVGDLSGLKLSELEAQAHAVVNALVGLLPGHEASCPAAQQLNAVIGELFNRGRRQDEEMQTLSGERDRLSKLLEALVEELEVHLEWPAECDDLIGDDDGDLSVESDAVESQFAKVSVASAKPGVVLDMRRNDDPDIIGAKPKAKAKALLQRLKDAQ